MSVAQPMLCQMTGWLMNKCMGTLSQDSQCPGYKIWYRHLLNMSEALPLEKTCLVYKLLQYCAHIWHAESFVSELNTATWHYRYGDMSAQSQSCRTRCPLLGNGSANIFPQAANRVTAATDTHTTKEELLEVVFRWVLVEAIYWGPNITVPRQMSSKPAVSVCLWYRVVANSGHMWLGVNGQESWPWAMRRLVASKNVNRRSDDYWRRDRMRRLSVR
jgi:hypothetical protein